MRSRRRVVWAVVLALGILAGAAWALRGWIAVRLMDRVVSANLTGNLLDELPEGLHVALCGAGSPIADPLRSGPCTAVIAGGGIWVVDAGSGAARVLARMRLPHGKVRAVLLTHFHSDHIDGLGELLLQRWVNAGATAPLPVWGPEGTAEVVAGFQRAYRADAAYRVAHHGEEIVPPGGFGGRAREFSLPRDGEGRKLFSDGGLRVTAFRVDHDPAVPAVGYRFDYRGRAVVVSGDTKRSENVLRFAQGADLLVHEALAPALVGRITRAAERAGRPRLAKITRDIISYHTTPRGAAEIARRAGVRHLLLTHIVPPLPLRALEGPFLEGVRQAWDGPVTVGRDGTVASIDLLSGEVRIRRFL